MLNSFSLISQIDFGTAKLVLVTEALEEFFKEIPYLLQCQKRRVVLSRCYD